MTKKQRRSGTLSKTNGEKVRDLIFKDEYDPTYAERSKKVRFAVDSRQYEIEGGGLSRQSFIVVRENTFNTIIRYTGLERYANALNPKAGKDATAPNEKRLYIIVAFLNWILIDQYEKYQIKRLSYITFECIEDFCTMYATRKNKYNRYNSKETIQKHINYLVGFLHTLQKRKFLKNIRADVLTRTIIAKVDGRDVMKVVSSVDYRYIEQKPLKKIRDLPDSVFQALFFVASIHDPMMVLAFAAQAFSGLREGEVLNLRGMDSCFGPGLFFTECAGQIVDVELDVTNEYLMRNDAVKKEDIKRYRKPRVYPLFVNDFVAIYEKHIKMLETYKRENSKPLFINDRPNKNGIYEALTYRSYLDRFDRLLIKLQEYLMKSENLEMKTFADLMLTAKVVPHSFRHYFTVQVLLSEKGDDILPVLMYWRGDRSPQACIPYIRNKGHFKKMYKRVNQIHGTFLAKEIFKNMEE